MRGGRAADRLGRGERQSETLHGTLGERALIIGVDRLDYSKGIVERLRGYQLLLSEYPRHRRNVVFMQISAPSREDLPEYRDMRRSIERLVGHVVGRYGEADWIPLRYLNRTHSRRTLAGYYRAARVGLVTPLRDGLNLVAEEYVVAQDAAIRACSCCRALPARLRAWTARGGQPVRRVRMSPRRSTAA